MRRKSGLAFMGMGTALLIAALFLLIFNWIEDRKAGDAADEILSSVISLEDSDKTAPESNENTDMTVVDIDGYGYIGYLSIPALELVLPVMSEWDNSRLKTAPCRYFGSTKTNDLVICGHNYNSHFGRLKNLQPGDQVFFTDMDGVTITYKVEDLETLQPAQITEMTESNYDLTLYTCTYGGKTRMTVRCDQVETG